MLGATSTRLPTSARRPLLSIPWPKGGRLDPLFWVSAYGRRPRCPYGGAYPYCREPYLPPPPPPAKNTCPYGGTWPYCNEPTQMAMSGLGLAVPGTMVLPGMQPGSAYVGTGPRRPPPPPLRPAGFLGLGAITDVDPKRLLLMGIVGGVLLGVGGSYFAFGR